MKKTNIKDVVYNYAELDLALIVEDIYAKLTPRDILVFTMLKNQESLSINSVKSGNDDYVDAKGNVFIRISQEKLSKILRISEPTLRSSLKLLQKLDLIEVVKFGKNECNIIYVGTPESKTTYKDYVKKIGLEINEAKKIEKAEKVKGKNDKVKASNIAKLKESNKKDLSAATDKPLKVINKNSFDTDSITQNNENIQEENNSNLKLIKDFGIEVPKHTSELLKNEVSKWDTDLLVLCMEYMNSKKNTISKYSIQYLVSIYNKPDFLNYKGVQPKAAEVSKNEYKINLNPKIHNFEGSTDFLKYSDEELEDIILKGQKNKFREI